MSKKFLNTVNCIVNNEKYWAFYDPILECFVLDYTFKSGNSIQYQCETKEDIFSFLNFIKHLDSKF